MLPTLPVLSRHLRINQPDLIYESNFSDDITIKEDPQPNIAGRSTCKKSSCNGMILASNIYGANVTFGECNSSIGQEELKFCFVNEDSICSKIPFKGLPGTFYSTESCKSDPNDRRFGFIAYIGFLIG